MSDPLDWNAKTIAELRANEGRVGGATCSFAYELTGVT
jgi:hypothetical protein